MADQFASGGLGLNAADVTRRRAVQMIEMGEFDTAIALATDALKARPRDAQMLWVIGEALTGLGRLTDAAIKLRQALGVHPEHDNALCSLAEIHRMQGDPEKALELITRARAFSTSTRPYTLGASILADMGQYEQAAALLEPKIKVDNPDTRIVVAYADLCIALKQPEIGIDLLEAALTRGELHTGVRSGALMILGRLLDRVGRYDDAFNAYKRANDMRSTNEEQRADAIFEGWSKDAIAAAPRTRVKTDRSVLVVGMPRSGTTLTESVIAAHPDAAGVGESQLLMTMRRATTAAELTQASVDSMAKRYTDMLAREGSKTATRVVDKMPDNYQNLGLAACALPQTRVVWCQRDPRDVCLSCYFQNFGTRHAYTCDLELTAQRYLLHTQLMEHWKSTGSHPPTSPCTSSATRSSSPTWTARSAPCSGSWACPTTSAASPRTRRRARSPPPAATRSASRSTRPPRPAGNATRSTSGPWSRSSKQAGPSDMQGTNPNAMAQQALQAFQRGDYPRAESLCRQLLKIAKNDPGILNMLGTCLTRQGKLGEAREHLRASLKRNPRSEQAWCDLAFNLRLDDKPDEAFDAIDRVLRTDPTNGQALHLKAMLCNDLGKPDEGLAFIEPVATAPGAPPATVIAYAMLSRTPEHQARGVELLEALLANPGTPPGVKRSALYQLGALRDRLKDHDAAFEAIAKASAFVPQGAVTPAQPTIDAWNAETLARIPQAELDASCVVLVVGMPRSGTTLTEQIIAAHPRADGVGERADLGHLARAHPVDALDQASVNEVGTTYVNALRARAGDEPERIVDKMPGNAMHLALASRALPGARAVWCRRDPRDIVLSCHFQDFGDVHRYTSDLELCAQSVVEHTRLMRYWQQALDLPIHEMVYENLVDDPEGQTRALCAFLGLDYDPACLEFHSAGRFVRTLSHAQVRRPIYKSSSARWKAYETQLAPAIEILSAAGLIEN